MKKIIEKNKLSSFRLYKRSIFLDCADIHEIEKWNSTGVIDGVTTNQAIMLKDGVRKDDYKDKIRKISKEMSGKHVSIELTDSTKSEKELILEARKLSSIASNIVIKVPVIPNTLKSLTIINTLIRENIAVNATVAMTYEQIVMAILSLRKSKKTSFVSLFWGRSQEDHTNYRSRFDFMAKYTSVGIESEVNRNPKNIVSAASQFIKEGGFENIRLIAGSIRTASMIGEAFAAGANIVTATPDKLISMLFSQRTIETLKQFDMAWKTIQNK